MKKTDYQQFSFVNGFDGSQLRSRIKMMNRRQRSRWRMLKYPLMLMLAACLTMAFVTKIGMSKYLLEKNGTLHFVITPRMTFEEIVQLKNDIEAKVPNAKLNLKQLNYGYGGIGFIHSIQAEITTYDKDGGEISNAQTRSIKDEFTPANAIYFEVEIKKPNGVGITTVPTENTPQELIAINQKDVDFVFNENKNNIQYISTKGRKAVMKSLHLTEDNFESYYDAIQRVRQNNENWFQEIEKYFSRIIALSNVRRKGKGENTIDIGIDKAFYFVDSQRVSFENFKTLNHKNIRSIEHTAGFNNNNRQPLIIIMAFTETSFTK